MPTSTHPTLTPNPAASREAAVRLACSLLGLHERDPLIQALFIRGIDTYYRWAVPPSTVPDWCVSFVSHVTRMGMGLTDAWRENMHDAFAPKDPHHPFGRWLVNVQDLVKWAREGGHVVPLGSVRPGDIFVQCTSGRPTHVGMVLEAGGLSFVTIEGNWGDRVSSRVVDLSGDINDQEQYTMPRTRARTFFFVAFPYGA